MGFSTMVILGQEDVLHWGCLELVAVRWRGEKGRRRSLDDQTSGKRKKIWTRAQAIPVIAIRLLLLSNPLLILMRLSPLQAMVNLCQSPIRSPRV
jgi:hypothetical protein